MTRVSLRAFDRCLLGVLSCAAVLGVVAPSAARADAPLSAVPVAGAAADLADQIVVRHRASLSAGERADLRAGAGVTLDRTLPLTGVEVVQTDGTAGARAEALSALRADPDVLWAEPNQVVTASTADPFYPREWGLDNTGQVYAYDQTTGAPGPGGTQDADVDAPEAWTVTRGAGVTVGVVDTGVQADHPDLAGQLVQGTNYVTDQSQADTTDGEGHGTHVSGTIAATADNGIGVAGVAPAAQVRPYRALGNDGSGSTADVAAAFAAAGAAGIRVVNASLGSTGSAASVQVETQAIASHPGTLYVVAAGNAGANVETTKTYPCSSPAANVLCVGASNSNDQPASFSNYGSTSVDLFAPGVDIASTWIGSGYAYASGTSMATPMVSGVAALVASAHPTWSPAQIKAAILNSVDHPAALAGKSVTGGRLNAARALGVDVGPDGQAPAQPSVTPTTPQPTTPPPGAATSVAPTTPGPTTPAPAATTPVVAAPLTTGVTDGAGSGSSGGAAGASDANATLPALPDVGLIVPVSAGASPAASAVAPTPAPAHLSSVRLLSTRGVARQLRFHLSAASTLTVSVQRRRRDGSLTSAAKRTFDRPAGTGSLKITGSGQALGLHHGMWRVALRSAAGDVSVVWVRVR